MDSGSWWWTGRPGVLWFIGLQRVRHNWVTELNWKHYKLLYNSTVHFCYCLYSLVWFAFYCHPSTLPNLAHKLFSRKILCSCLLIFCFSKNIWPHIVPTAGAQWMLTEMNRYYIKIFWQNHLQEAAADAAGSTRWPSCLLGGRWVTQGFPGRNMATLVTVFIFSQHSCLTVRKVQLNTEKMKSFLEDVSFSLIWLYYLSVKSWTIYYLFLKIKLYQSLATAVKNDHNLLGKK